MTIKGPVLLVDDNPIDLFLNKKLIELSELGADFITFPSGKEALEFVIALGEYKGEWPAYMLLDIQMPVMDGFEFLRRYETDAPREVKDRLVIYMLSSTADQSDLRRVRENPWVRRVFKKPLEPSLLKEALKKL